MRHKVVPLSLASKGIQALAKAVNTVLATLAEGAAEVPDTVSQAFIALVTTIYSCRFNYGINGCPKLTC